MYLDEKEVDLSIKATSYFGITSYGKILIGSKGFYYYNQKNVLDFIFIPWNEVENVIASVMFNRYITRFAIFTKSNGHFSFSTTDNKKTLRAVSKYVDKDHMLKSKTFLQVVFLGLKNLLRIK